jgi:phosphomannomutase
LDALVINDRPDGAFPNHGPNPLEAGSIRQAARKVVETGADLGAVLDGDGDRVIFVDEKGSHIPAYFSSALVAEELLQENPGGTVVYDLISSRALPEWIGEKGGRAVVSRVGYTFLYDRMKGEKAVFGAEASGHVYFRVTDSYYTESAAYAIIMMLRLLDRRGKALSELIAPIGGRYSQAPEINLAVEREGEAFRRIEERYAEHITSRLDGISVSLPDFWFNLRPSNTEPVLRLRLEAVDQEIAAARLNELVLVITGEERHEDKV